MMEGRATLIMELSMVERKTPTATIKKTLQRFLFEREDKRRAKKDRFVKNKKKRALINRARFTHQR